MNDSIEGLDFDNIPKPVVGWMERYVKLPIWIASAIFMGVSGLFIDSYEYAAQYYGAAHISYNEAYRYYPLMLMGAFFAVFILRLTMEVLIVILITKITKKKKWRFLHLRWDMVIISILFALWQLKTLEEANIKLI